MMAGATYDDFGVRFGYPEDWQVEVNEDETVRTIAVQAGSAGLAFALVTIDETRPDPREVADEALSAMHDEYDNLDSVPVEETLNGYSAVGYDVEFFSLDVTNNCAIRCYRTPRRTVLFFGQWSDLDGEVNEPAITDIRRSLRETDANDA